MGVTGYHRKKNDETFCKMKCPYALKMKCPCPRLWGFHFLKCLARFYAL